MLSVIGARKEAQTQFWLHFFIMIIKVHYLSVVEYPNIWVSISFVGNVYHDAISGLFVQQKK
ncbi:hypothetical protein BD408DRAFT_82280 [Parasitella parasitica]|nr:hypothetical protein BD408DRAFT_82280 [Parasitella parasitica]